MAGAECFKYVTSNSNTNGTDQNNLDVMLVSFPSRIVNRVDFVLGRDGHQPCNVCSRVHQASVPGSEHQLQAYFGWNSVHYVSLSVLFFGVSR